MIKASIASLLLFVTFAGCSSENETAESENAAGEGGGGSGGSATGGKSTGGRASGGSSGASGRGGSSGAAQGGTDAPGGMGGGPECGGDAETFAELTTGPFECERNSDCCVVIDGCLTEGRLVRAGDEDAALAAWPYCNDECTDCIPPKVVVGCDNGVCVGTEVEDEDFDSPLRDTHCGVDDEATSPGTGDTFGCGG